MQPTNGQLHLPLMICVSVGQNPPGHLLIFVYRNIILWPHVLQDGHNPPDVFCNVKRPRPSQDVTDILKRYNVHIVKLGHKAFYANYAYVFIDIDQLEGKPMQIKEKIYYVVQKIYKSIFTNCYDCSTTLRVVQ